MSGKPRTWRPYLRHGRRYRAARELMFKIYGTTCHLCEHPGADQADHLVAVTVDPNQGVDYRNLRPAHGINGCPTCGRKCNQQKGNGTSRAAQRMVTVPQQRLRTSEDW